MATRTDPLKVPRQPENLFELIEEAQEFSLDSRKNKKDTIIPLTEATTLLGETWWTILLVCNMYNYVAFFLYLGVPLKLDGAVLLCEVFAELVLLADAAALVYQYVHMRTQAGEQKTKEDVELARKKSAMSLSLLGLCAKCLASYPQYTMHLVYGLQASSLNSLTVALLRMLKLLRSPEILAYVSRKIMAVTGTSRAYWMFGKYTLLILMFIHALSMIWMSLATRDASAGSWETIFNFTQASTFEIYTQSLNVIVSSTGSLNYSFTYPATSTEKLMFCVVILLESILLAALIGSITNLIYLQNTRATENANDVEHAKLLAKTRGLSNKFRNKLVEYYLSAHQDFKEYMERYSMLKSLPPPLRRPLMFKVNHDFICSVKLFQQIRDPSIVVEFIERMQPMICLAGDYIVRKGEIAHSMYFICSGVAKAVAADNEMLVLSYMGKGKYFGEIGVLLAGKRSVSVLAVTNCLLYRVDKPGLLKLIEKQKFVKDVLEGVGHQRLKTTYSEGRLLNGEDDPLMKIQQLQQFKAEAEASFTHVLTTYALELGVFLSVLWNISYTAYAICIEDVIPQRSVHVILIEALCYATLVGDTVFRLYYRDRGTSTTSAIIDLLSLLPVDYLLYASGQDQPWARLLRLLKTYRLGEIYSFFGRVVKRLNIIALIVCYIVLAHVFSCGMYWVALVEYERGGRFDGKSIVFFLVDIPSQYSLIQYPYTSFSEAAKQSMAERYLHSLYLIVSIMTTAVCGEISPVTSLEQLYTSFVTLVSILLQAFFYSECSNMITRMYGAEVEHLSKSSLMVEWMEINKCPKELCTRVEKYRELLWERKRGVEDQVLLDAMPESLRCQTKYEILGQLVKHADVFPRDEHGAVVSIINRLTIVFYPKDELIMRQGEIPADMYFVIEGVVEIRTSSGLKLTELRAGKCFGEMALLKETLQPRSASAYAATDVSLAKISKTDLDLASSIYPSFKTKLVELAKERERQNQQRAAAVVKPEENVNSCLNTEEKEHSPKSANEAAPMPRSFSSKVEETKQGPGDAEGKGQAMRITLDILGSAASLYNLVFVPLQMALRIEYTPALYVIEGLMLTLYILEIALLIYDIKQVSHEMEDTTEMSEQKAKLVRDKRRALLIRLACEVLTAIPWSIILQSVYYPTYVVAFVKMLRVWRVWPLSRLVSLLQSWWFNEMRVLMILISYFFVQHISTCMRMLMMYVPEYINDSWGGQVPYPLADMSGHRVKDDMAGVTDEDLYVHFLTGYMSSTNISERIMIIVDDSLFLLCYLYLFATLSSITADIERSKFATLQTRFEEVSVAMNKSLPSKKLCLRVQKHFSSLWEESKGLDGRFVYELPVSLKMDLLLFVYWNALKKSVLFQGSTGEFVPSIAGEFLKLSAIERYTRGDVLVKVGSYSSKTFLLLEGELYLFSPAGKCVGAIRPGLAYSRATEDGGWERSPAYLVAAKESTVGIIRQQKLDVLLQFYPSVKQRLFSMNQLILGKCKEPIAITGQDIPKAIEEEYATADQSKYKRMREDWLENNVTKDCDFFQLLTSPADNEPSTERHMESTESHKFYVDPKGKYYFLVYLLHLINVVYIAVVLPFHVFSVWNSSQVAFESEYLGVYTGLEVISLLETLGYLLVQFRTPTLQRGPSLSYKLGDIYRRCQESGLFIDLFALSPLNIIFYELQIRSPLYLILFFRLLRLATMLNFSLLFQQLQLRSFSCSSVLKIIKAFVFLILLCHWFACVWFFINHEIEDSVTLTWEKLNGLRNETRSRQYAFSLYYVMKLVAGFDVGEDIACTNGEKVVQFVFTCCGDIVLAVIFGIISGFTESVYDVENMEVIRNQKIDRFAEQFQLSPHEKTGVNEYFYYLNSLKGDPGIFNKIRHLLPSPLVKEIAYETNKHLLIPMFETIASYNFIKKLAHSLDTAYYIPGEYIINKGDYGEEMYFLADGMVAIVATDKKKILKTLSAGSYFGEIALFAHCRRVCYVRAETYCCVCVLKKSVVEKLMLHFPLAAEKLKKLGERRLEEFKLKDRRGSDLEPEEFAALVQQLNEDGEAANKGTGILQPEDDDEAKEGEEKPAETNEVRIVIKDPKEFEEDKQSPEGENLDSKKSTAPLLEEKPCSLLKPPGAGTGLVPPAVTKHVKRLSRIGVKKRRGSQTKSLLIGDNSFISGSSKPPVALCLESSTSDANHLTLQEGGRALHCHASLRFCSQLRQSSIASSINSAQS